MSESERGPRKIKVVDRRRFDETGDLRPDRPEVKKSEPAPIPAEPAGTAAGEVPATPAPPPDPAPTPSAPPSAGGSASSQSTLPLFMDLVAGLAQQAEMLLVGAQGLPAQPAEAQRVIEYLSMLETKTAGNLSAEEKQVLSGVIFQLRTLYVQHTS